MKAKKNIMLIDDHSLFLKGMKHLVSKISPSHEIITYNSLKDFFENKNSINQTELIISDIELPNENVFELFDFIKEEYPQIPILVVSMHKKIALIRKCKAIGIQSYILKNEDEFLSKAVKITLMGGRFYSPGIELFYSKSKSDLQTLSEREEEIIKLIAKGHLNKDIAEQLFISIETVKTHKKNIKLKLDINKTVDIIKYAKLNFLL